MTFDPREEMTDAERGCRDAGWLTPLEAFDLRQELERLNGEIASQSDKAFVLGARFGWNCAVEEWEPSPIERGMSPQTWAARDAVRAARRKRFDDAIAARNQEHVLQKDHSREGFSLNDDQSIR